MTISRREILRQPVHILFGLFFLFLVWKNLITIERLTIAFPLLLVVLALVKTGYFPVATPLLKWLERPKDMEILPGKSLFALFISTFLLLLWFPKQITLAALMVWAVGDGLNHLIGATLGRIPVPFNPKKNVEGPIAATIVASVGAHLFLPWVPAIIGSAFAMLVELHPHRFFGWHIPDNLTVPLAAAFAMTLVLSFVS